MISLLSECKKCHFTVSHELFLTPEARLYFPNLPRIDSELRQYDGFHRFDLILVECLLRREVFREAFYVRMIGLAKELQKIYNDTRDEISLDCDLANLRRRDLIKKDPKLKDELHPMTISEQQEMFDMQSGKSLRTKMRGLTASADEVAEMRLDLHARIMRYDNYAKSRRILYKLSSDDRAALSANATGETRYAYILYTIDTYLAHFLSFLLEKPVSGILSSTALSGTQHRLRCARPKTVV